MPKEIDDYGSYDVPNNTPFLKLEAGDNKIRLCSKPVELPFYQASRKGEKYATVQLNTQAEIDQAIVEGKKIKYKYAYLAINRRDGKLYVWESSVQAFRSIVSFARNPEYGDPTQYDITVNRSGEGINTQYSVIPARNSSPFTDEELEMIENGKDMIEQTYKKEN